MQQMPPEFSRKWWRLWYSGAIDREKVFFKILARELIVRKTTCPLYYMENEDDVFHGRRLSDWTRGFLDLSAVVRQDLNLPWGKYEACMTKLLGKTASEADKIWREGKNVERTND